MECRTFDCIPSFLSYHSHPVFHSTRLPLTRRRRYCPRRCALRSVRRHDELKEIDSSPTCALSVALHSGRHAISMTCFLEFSTQPLQLIFPVHCERTLS
ncbi:hypothetical protein DFP72DRAFT_1063991 [Ephemerocybe angulata]|uniref:Uncharacterized protein n=1 Tax=Ephemerocybe angulata TaxID=980116 RepID=A0A8H6I998_9AGAR|nr:hypothetical protein DFP72DRAFT_1063989 [Tulosesus angulatus]KAF6759649.1 hypothetical protein DFP72DRAFT_1063991 [Tulosesus angulatus]